MPTGRYTHYGNCIVCGKSVNEMNIIKSFVSMLIFEPIHHSCYFSIIDKKDYKKIEDRYDEKYGLMVARVKALSVCNKRIYFDRLFIVGDRPLMLHFTLNDFFQDVIKKGLTI